MNIIFTYLRKLTEGKAKESSKRFMALFTMVLVSYVVIRYTNEKNCELILGELLSFILVLSGVATWQNLQKNKIEKQGQNEDLLNST